MRKSKLMKNITCIFLVSCLIFGQLTCVTAFGPYDFSSSAFGLSLYFGNGYLVKTQVPNQSHPRHDGDFLRISDTMLNIDGTFLTLEKPRHSSSSPYRVFPIRMSEKLSPTKTITKLVGNAIKIGGKYYVQRDDIYNLKDANLNDFIDAFNGNRTYVKDPVNGLKLITVEQRKDTFVFKVEDDLEDSTSTNTMDPPMYLYELQNIVQLCGASMADNINSTGYIDVTVTESPEVTIETAADSQNYIIIDPVTKKATTQIQVKVQTFNKFNNNSMNITFNKPDGITVGATGSVNGYFDKAVPTVYSGTPDANGILTYSDTLTLTISKNGLYNCGLTAVDGVGRASNYLPPDLTTNPDDSSYYYCPSVTIMANDFIQMPSMETIRNTMSVTGLSLEKLDENSKLNNGINPTGSDSYGIKGYTKPIYPGSTFKIIVPAGESILFQCKFHTYSEGRCSDAPDVNVAYSIKFTTKAATGGYAYKLVEGTMSNVEKYYTYSESCCPCRGPDPCGCPKYISSKNFVYREILKIPDNVVDGEYEIKISARGGRQRFNSDNARLTAGTSGVSARILTVYTPLRQSFKQTWFKDI